MLSVSLLFAGSRADTVDRRKSLISLTESPVGEAERQRLYQVPHETIRHLYLAKVEGKGRGLIAHSTIKKGMVVATMSGTRAVLAAAPPGKEAVEMTKPKDGKPGVYVILHEADYDNPGAFPFPLLPPAGQISEKNPFWVDLGGPPRRVQSSF